MMAAAGFTVARSIIDASEFLETSKLAQIALEPVFSCFKSSENMSQQVTKTRNGNFIRLRFR
ncbi:MAG: hypothetical protein CMM76_11055 [Rhodospirillaceae bacterium]|nr:hypothetical protein [Rhodospirillaceae bacterium]